MTASRTAQAPGYYRYKVGDVIVTAVHDGIQEFPLEGFVRNASIAEVEAALAEAFMPSGKMTITFTTLVLDSGSDLTLIDTGFGDIGPPTVGLWLANFEAAGFKISDIKTVVISHCHGDHINGLRLKDGTLRFPHARILVPAKDYAYWMSADEMNKASDAGKAAFQRVHRVFDGLKVEQYNWDDEVVPGLKAIAAPGHTPGHTAFMLSSGGSKLMIMSDVTNHPALFVRNPGWQAGFDVIPELTIKTRRELLGKAADERVQTSFFHAPFPATGHVVRDGERFRFVPLHHMPTV